MVFSYAPNLASFRQAQNPSGIRMDFHDHLRGAFSTLEKYGAQLRSELGEAFKRSIKFDDSTMSLRIDVRLPGEERWTHVPLEIAVEEVDKRKGKETAATRERLTSASNPSGDVMEVECLAGSSSAPGPSTLPISNTLQQFGTERPRSRWGEK